MRTVTVQAGVTIDLGHQYDNYATEVVFPSAIIDPFITNFGSSGTFAIWYRRSGDPIGYPIGSPLVTFDSTNSEVTWDVVESDTASPGVSQVQLRYIVDEVCVMSQIFAGNVADSVDTGTEVPEPMEQWADAIVSAGAGGQPTVATSASAMSDHNTIYLYTGSESGYIYGHIYYWNGSAWTDGGAYGGGSSSGGSGLTDGIKQALLDCFEHVAWTDEHGQDYVDALEAALYPPAELVSISAVYTQSGTVYTTDSLDDLKSDLVVTAIYNDSTTETVTTYTLSGTLTEGTSVITVSYGGKTTTFNVTVTAPATLSSITAVYTQSGTVYDTDTLDSLKSDLVVTAVYSDSTTEVVTNYTLSGTLTEGTSTITVAYGGKTTTFTVTVTEAPLTPIYNWDLKSSLTDSVGGITASTTATFTSGTGLVFSAYSKYCDFGAIYALNRTYELDVVEHAQTNTGGNGRLFAVDTDADTSSGGSAFLYTGSRRTAQNPSGYGIYTGSAWDTQSFSAIGTGTTENSYNSRFFDGKTIKIYISSDGKCSVSYKTIEADDSTYVFLGTSETAFDSHTDGHVYIGSDSNDYLYNTTVSGFRVYEGEV